MKLFNAIAGAALVGTSFITTAPAEADTATKQEWCEVNLEHAVDTFNKSANNAESKIATLTGPVRAVNIHSDAFWSGGQRITGCQFNFRTVSGAHALGRFNIERLSSGRIMVGTAAWSAN